MRTVINQLNREIGDILVAQKLKAVAEDADFDESLINFVDAKGRKSLVTMDVTSDHDLRQAGISVAILKEHPIFDDWKIVEYEGIEHALFPREGDAIKALRDELIKHEGKFDWSEGVHNKVLNHPLTPVTLKAVTELFSELGVECQFTPFNASKSSGEGFVAMSPQGTSYRFESQDGGCLLSIDGGENISFLSGRTVKYEVNLRAYLTAVFLKNNPALTEALTNTMDEAFSKWLPAEGVLWQADKIHAIDEMERVAFAIDPNRNEVTIHRGWLTDSNPQVSVDLSVPFGALEEEFDEMNFAHAIPKDQNRLSQAFADSLPNQHVEILWHHSSSDMQGFFIARTAKPGRDDRLVIGEVQVNHVGQLQVKHALDERLESLNPNNTSSFKM